MIKEMENTSNPTASIDLKLSVTQIPLGDGQVFQAHICCPKNKTVAPVQTGFYSHPRDAIYSALFNLGVLNNFNGCLDLDNNNQAVKSEK